MKKLLAIFVAATMLLSGCSALESAQKLGERLNDPIFQSEPATETEEKTTSGSNGNSALVHFFDVGQGDSEFIELPDGKTILIDGSTRSAGDIVVSDITELGYDTIDYVIATHPHEDHIGGLTDVFDAFQIGSVVMSDGVTTTKTFEKFLNKIEEYNIPVSVPAPSSIIAEGNGYVLTCLGPINKGYDDLNEYSIVVKLVVNGTSFLFTGDAEALNENEMLQAGAEVNADVLKVGHHGSSTSTSEAFLSAVSPEVAIISCGVDNEYGHPHDETLEKLSAANVETYRTDLNGDITVFVSATGEISVATAK